jgi:hypothetical protein
MRVCSRLAALGVALALAGGSAIAWADEGALAPVEAGPGAGPKSIVWVDPAEDRGQRTSTGAMVVGVGLAIVGTIQIPIGVAMLSGSGIACLEPPRHAGGTNFSCQDPEASKHRAGGILMGIGVASAISGIALTIWGATRKSQAPDVRLGLGSVAATYRF